MDYKLEDLIDIPFIQDLLDKLNEIYPFPSAIIDNEGKILTATAWQPICTRFHRANPVSEIECIASDKYILDHISEAKPAVSYRCPHGMIDNAIPIIINGKHLANFFTGQFFLRPPDLDFFRAQAKNYGFDQTAYLEAVQKTPVWDEDQLNKYIAFIHPFVKSLAETGLTRLQDLEKNKILHDSETRYRDLFETAPVMYVITHDVNGLPVITDCNQRLLDALGYKRIELLGKELSELYTTETNIKFLQQGGYQRALATGTQAEEHTLVCRDGSQLDCLIWSQPEKGPGGNVIGLRATYMDISRRKETEQALQESERRYSVTMDALADGIHVVDRELNLVLSNASMSKWMQELGYTSILVGKNLFKAFPFLPEKVRQEYQQVFNSGEPLISMEETTAGGGQIWTETRKIPILENGRVERVVTVVRNITASRQAEAELQARTVELDRYFNSTLDLFCVADTAGFFRRLNPQWEITLGYSLQELEGKQFMDFVHPDDQASTMEAVTRLVAQEEVLNFQNRYRCKDGSYRWIEWRSQPAGDLIYAAAHDITDRKQAEQALQESEEKFKTTFMTSLDGVFIASLDEGKIVDVNNAFEKMFGYTRQEVIGRTSSELNFHVIRSRRKSVIAELKKQGSLKDMQVKARKKDGTIIDCSFSVRIVTLKGSLHSVGVIRDVTEPTRLAQQLQERLKELTCLSEIRHTMVAQTTLEDLCQTILTALVPAMQYPELASAEIAVDGSTFSTLSEKKKTRKAGTEPGLHADIILNGIKRGWLSVHYNQPIPFLIPEEQNLLYAIAEEMSLWLGKQEAEKEMHTARAYWQELVENTSDLVTVLDADGIIRYQNSAISHKLGFPPDEVTGRHASDFIHPEDWERVWGIFITDLNEPSSKFPPVEFRLRTRDGSWKSMETTSEIRQDANGKPFAVLTSHDITNRKAIDMDLRASEEKYRSLFNSMVEGVSINQLIRNKQGEVVDYRVLEINRGFEKAARVKAAEIEQQLATKIYGMTPEYIRTWWDQHVFLDGSAYTEYYDERNGSWAAVTTTEPIKDRFYTIFTDITERKNYEKVLKDNETRNWNILQTALDGFWITDLQGRILDVNESYCQRSGYTREELLSMSISDVEVLETAETTRAHIHNIQEKGYERFETRHRCKDGSFIDVEISARFQDHQGGRMVAFIHDITRQKQFLREIEQANERLSLAQAASQAGTYDWDIVNNTFIWSPEFRQLFGMPPDAVAGFESWTKVLHPQDVELASRKIQEAIDRHIDLINDYRVILPDGQVRWVRARGKVLYAGEKPIRLTGLCIDITPIREIEQASRENMRNLETILNAIQESILLVDCDGTVIIANQTVADRFGRQPASLIGSNVNDLVDKKVSAHRRKFIQQVISSGLPVRFEDQRGDRTIDNVIYPICDEHGKVVRLALFGQDITDRIHAEHELSQSEARFRSIIEASPVPYALNDDRQNNIYLNQAFVNTFGYTLQDIPSLADWWPKAYPDEEYRRTVSTTWQQRLEQSLETGNPFEPMEVEIHCKDGSLRTALVGATPLEDLSKGIHLVVLYDISGRKQAEKQLESQRNFATQVLTSMGQGLSVTDELGRFEYVNTAYARITGYASEELLGKRPDDINWSEDLEILKTAMEQRQRGETTTYETRLKHKDGHAVHVMITGVPRMKAGQVCGTIAVITDLTERKLVEQALQRRNQFLVALQNTTLELVSQLDLHTLLENIVRRACNLVGLEAGLLDLVDPEKNLLIPQVGIGVLEESLHIPVQPGQGLTGLVWQSGEMHIIPDYDQWAGRLSSFSYNRLSTVIGLPLLSGGKVMGVLVTGSEYGNPHTFDPEAIEILNQFARLATVAVQNARLFSKVQDELTERTWVEEQLRKRAEELNALQKVLLELSATQNLPGLLESIVERACQLVDAPGGGLYLNDNDQQELRCVVSHHTQKDYRGTVLKYGEGVAGRIAQSGLSLNITDYQNWSGRAPAFEQEKPFSAVLGVPLLWGGKVTGVIDLLHFEKDRQFQPQDQEVLNLFAGHAAIAIENARLLQESISRNEEITQLSNRLAEAEENERRRIARELHDQVGQSLSALSLNLNIMHSQMPEYLPGFKRRLEDSLMLIDQTTDNIRSLMSELRPAVLDDYGLKAALEWAATTIARRTDLKVSVVGACNRFDPRVEIALFRIAQEALANVTRHAQASLVDILLSQDGPEFSMSITDDGIGLGTTLSLESKGGGMGLRLMRERAEAIGCSLQISSAHRKGTTITVRYHDPDPAGR